MPSDAEKLDYYAFRQGAARPPLSYADLRRLMVGLFGELESEGWFQDALGLDCVDNHKDIGAKLLADLGYDLWPFSNTMKDQDAEWLFTAIEYSYRHVAEPVQRNWHAWDQCGWHVQEASRQAGRAKFQLRVNELLARYEPRYVLADDGLIYELPPEGLEDLLVPAPSGDEMLDSRLDSALRTFRRYSATDDDKRHAIKDMADIFEQLRATNGTMLPSKDEDELFIIANKFGIRHFNPTQKTDYDSGPWLDWMFYAFLNAYRLAVRLQARHAATSTET